MLRRLQYVLIGFAGLGLVVLVLWAVVVVPPLLLGVDQFRDVRQIPDPAQRLDEVNGLRTTLAGVLGGLAVIAGAVVGALNFRETQRQNRSVLELQRRGQVTERFTRAIEQLGQQGPEKLDVRIGAAYALEQIARDSPELHWPIMEVLTAYLREHARRHPGAELQADVPGAAPTRLAADHQAIATVIGRRRSEQDPEGQRLDLSATSLPGVQWGRACLRRANLYRADLEGAYLRWAHLDGAGMVAANLRNAHLERAYLGEARLQEANLQSAWLGNTDLSATRGLTWEQLQGAGDLTGTALPAEATAPAGADAEHAPRPPAARTQPLP